MTEKPVDLCVKTSDDINGHRFVVTVSGHYLVDRDVVPRETWRRARCRELGAALKASGLSVSIPGAMSYLVRVNYRSSRDWLSEAETVTVEASSVCEAIAMASSRVRCPGRRIAGGELVGRPVPIYANGRVVR